MAEITVKQYKRKDGTVVRGSTRKLTKAEKQARKQYLGSHLKKGAKIGAAIQGGLGALQGAAAGTLLAGPAGTLPGAVYGGAAGALGGGLTGGTIGGGVYGVKRAMAKKRDPKGFKKSFDYKRNSENMMEFARGKDKTKRKKRQNKIGGHIRKGAKAFGAIGAINSGIAGAALAKQAGHGKAGILGAALGGAIGGGVTGAASGAIYGGATYGAKKAFAKDRSKKNFNYSKNTEDVKMFIGQQDESSINFARPKGAKDKMPRKKSGLRTAAKVGAGLAGAAAIGAGLKNRKAIGGALRNAGGAVRDTAMVGEMKARQMGRKGMNAASSAVGSARQKVGGKLDSIGQGMERRGGYDQVNARTSGGSFDQQLDGVRAGEKMASRGSALRKTAARIRGNR